MATTTDIQNEADIQEQNGNGHTAESLATTRPMQRPIPTPGRKLSREESVTRIFKKNDELYRRLA